MCKINLYYFRPTIWTLKIVTERETHSPNTNDLEIPVMVY